MAIQFKPSGKTGASGVKHSTPGIQQAPTAAVSPEALELEAAVQVIAFIMSNNMKSCWFSDADRRQTVAEGFSVVTSVLERKDRMRITVENNELKVNGEEYEIKSTQLREMVKHLTEVGPCNFTMERGLTKDEFVAITDFVSKPKHELTRNGDFTDAINAQKYQHVTSRRIILREVSEDEAVISKKELEAAAEDEKQQMEADVLALLTAEKKEDDAQKAVAQTGSLRRVADDSQKLSGLIMQAVEQKQSGASSADRKQVSALVVECLDKAFDALLADPFSKTQKGKKTIVAALQKLEQELLSKMEAEHEPGRENPVTSAVERMTERLKMDSVVQDYTRKLKALEDSEKKILRFIKLQGLDRVGDSELREKLGEEGVDVSDWHRLLAMSGADAPKTDDESDHAAAAVAQLASMLTRLESDVSALAKGDKPRSRDEVVKDLKEANAEVRIITEKTKDKITGLVESMREDMSTADLIEQEAVRAGRALKMPRKQMLKILGEAIQEMCQPLSVIRCSVDLLASKALGEVTQAQTDMLNLVGESAARIQVLADSLDRIAELPKTLEPDADIQKALSTGEWQP